jgi:hypothetical protein
MADYDQPTGMVEDPRILDIRRYARAAQATFAIEQIFGMYAAWKDYELTRWYGEYQQDVYKLNAKYAEIQARDAIRRGGQMAKRRAEEVGQVVGEQRVAGAAQGLAVGSGTIAEIQEEAITVGMMDALEIENNAYREAMGYKVQAAQNLVTGAARRLEARQEAETTLTTRVIGTARDVADRYYGTSGTGIVRRRGG